MRFMRSNLMLDADFAGLDVTCQFEERLGLTFSEDISAVGSNGFAAEFKFCTDLLIAFTIEKVFENLTFAYGEPIEA